MRETFNGSQLLSREDMSYLDDDLDVFRYLSSSNFGGMANGCIFWRVLTVSTLKNS